MTPATRTRSLAPTLRALALTAFAALALAPGAHADVYKWTDANGTTHYSDAAPGPAQRITLHDNKANPRGDAPLTPRPETLTPLATTTSGPGDTPPPPAPTRGDRLASYHASQECFAPFRNANGSVKPEAFSVCSVVKDPNGEQVR